MKKNDVIKKDTSLNFYIYQIELADHKQIGFLSLASIDDFLNNKIKAHEKIYESRKMERAEQMLNIQTQIGPIYVSFKTNKKIEYFCEPKIDGLSLNLTYKKGFLISAATRGDGTTGEDVSKNIVNIKNIPQKLKNNYPDYVYLFAWNHKDEIFKKEQDYSLKGGKWFSHVEI